MKLKPRQITVELWEQTEKLLDRWFAEGHTRSSVLPFRESEFPEDAALRAATLYKRGARGIRDLDSHKETLLNELRANDYTSQILSRSSWQQFLDNDFSSLLDTNSSTFIIDRRVAELHPDIVSSLSLSTHGRRFLLVDCNEQNKNLQTALSLLRQIDFRCAKIVAVGGGICCDMAGFVGGLLDAEIVMVPTTLLAAVDAGIGGKTGVNHAIAGKNQIGLFASIKAVVLISDLFKTLTPELVQEGLGEIIKHSWLAGKFENWKSAIDKLLEEPVTKTFSDPDVVQLMEENINFKSTVVQADPREKNIRVMLNLAHTVAHLLESLTLEISKNEAQQFIPSHGQAVSLGLWSLLESGLLHNPPDGLKPLLQRVIQAAGLDFPICPITGFRGHAMQILIQDKKNTQQNAGIGEQRVRCVLPNYGCLATIPHSLGIESFVSANTAELLPDELIDHLLGTGLFT